MQADNRNSLKTSQVKQEQISDLQETHTQSCRSNSKDTELLRCLNKAACCQSLKSAWTKLTLRWQIHDRLAPGVSRMMFTCLVLPCGLLIGTEFHFSFLSFWIVNSPICRWRRQIGLGGKYCDSAITRIRVVFYKDDVIYFVFVIRWLVIWCILIFLESEFNRQSISS